MPTNLELLNLARKLLAEEMTKRLPAEGRGAHDAPRHPFASGEELVSLSRLISNLEEITEVEEAARRWWRLEKDTRGDFTATGEELLQQVKDTLGRKSPRELAMQRLIRACNEEQLLPPGADIVARAVAALRAAKGAA